MSLPQIIYAVALASLFVWRGPSITAWVLLANFAATLATCLAEDYGMNEKTALLAMMLIDLAAATALIYSRDTLWPVVAGYAITIPFYSLTVVFDVQTATTFAIVIPIAFLQLVVVGIGSGGDDDRDGHRRGRGFHTLSDHLASSFQGNYVGERGMAQDRRLLSADSRGLRSGRG